MISVIFYSLHVRATVVPLVFLMCNIYSRFFNSDSFILLLFFIATHQAIFCSSVLSKVHCAHVDEGMCKCI